MKALSICLIFFATISASAHLENTQQRIKLEIRELNFFELCGSNFEYHEEPNLLAIECDDNALEHALYGDPQATVPKNAPTPAKLGLNSVSFYLFGVRTSQMLDQQDKLIGYATEYSFKNSLTGRPAGTVTFRYDLKGKLAYFSYFSMKKQ